MILPRSFRTGTGACLVVLTHFFCFLAPSPIFAAPRISGALATIHPLATQAGHQAFAEGGNAIDATVAAALTLGVVDGHNSGIGGGCLLLVRLPDGKVVAIDGRERAPALIKREDFLRDGKADTQLTQHGAFAIAVPGALAAYACALTNYGKLSLSNHLERAALLAETGFKIDRPYAERIASTAKELKKFEASSALFLDERGASLKSGSMLQQRDLALSYREIARHGVGWFYGGSFANAVAFWMRVQKGPINAADFRQYEIRLREPVRSTYRGFEIVGFPPPSSGGYHVAQILNILENFDLKSFRPDSAEFVHLVAEAMKVAFADRAHWLGDPDFVSVPRELTSKSYAQALARKIDPQRAARVETHGDPRGVPDPTEKKHTTHFSAADQEGNWVACTATINTSFGSKAVIPGTGVILNNEMDDFSLEPGVANYFGLVGSEANAVAPGKRPLSSMSPTLVLRDGKPILSLGAAGGPTIISQTLLAIIYTIDFGMKPEKALAQPRFHHQWRPDELRIEKKFSRSVVRELELRGHKVKVVDPIGAAQAVSFDGQEWIAVREPRLN